MIFNRLHSRRSAIWLTLALLVACPAITAGWTILHPPAAVAESLRDVWTTIKRIIYPSPPARKGAGGKGGEAILSPGVWVNAAAKAPQVPEVWHLRPVILYQSPANLNEAPDRIALMQGEAPGQTTPVQTFEVKGKTYDQLLVDAQLTPGQKYQIHQLKGKANRIIDRSIQFQVMPYGPVREAISTQLATVDCQFAADRERRSAERFKVFVAAGLWSDAMQELGALVKTDDDWQSLRTATIDRWEKAKQ
jgi:hypothetical protein